jgi:uncharacterized protein YecE (DUF72 family)
MTPSVESTVRIGPAGWSYADWEGIVYPRARNRSFDPLAFLASYFDLIEINSTFYRTPSRETCRRWVDRTADNPDFLFTAKAPQELTHGPRAASEGDVAGFKNAIEPLYESDRLGAVLLQFPWSFRASPEATAYLETLTGWFDPVATVVEVRHGTWGAPRALSFFRQSGIALCGIDQPAVGDSLGPGTHAPTGDRAYFRLHGRNKENWFRKEANRDERYDYLYDVSELSYWRDAVNETRGRARNVFVVLNNHFRGQAVVNALQLGAMLAGRPSPAPETLLSRYPAAGDLLRPRAAAGPSRRATQRNKQRRQLDLFGDGENGGGGGRREEDE